MTYLLNWSTGQLSVCQAMVPQQCLILFHHHQLNEWPENHTNTDTQAILYKLDFLSFQEQMRRCSSARGAVSEARVWYYGRDWQKADWQAGPDTRQHANKRSMPNQDNNRDPWLNSLKPCGVMHWWMTLRETIVQAIGRRNNIMHEREV